MDKGISELASKLFEKFDGPFFLKWFVPFVAVSIMLSCYVLIHPPMWLRSFVALPTFTAAEQKSLSIAFIVSVVILFLYVPFNLLYWITHRPKPRKSRTEPTHEILKDLPNLSDQEQTLLAICLYRNQQTFTAPTAAPTVQHLIRRGIVTLGGSIGYQRSFPFMIDGPVWSHLKQHPEEFASPLISQLPDFSTEEIEQLWLRVTSDGLGLI
jgi:lysylphosphatidylglycerol synthetase-like protein (DUF2156 family)